MHIHKVTDLRTGLPHPRRASTGQFISRKLAARIAQGWEGEIQRHERGEVPFFSWHSFVSHILPFAWR